MDEPLVTMSRADHAAGALRVVENAEVVRWLLDWQSGREWSGTASQLLAQIQGALYPDPFSIASKAVLPKNPAQLGKLLRSGNSASSAWKADRL
jgi:hypothetical protein